MNTTNPWDEHAADWDTDPGPRAYAAAAFESLLVELERLGCPLEGLRVLDFGCGTGLLSELLVGRADRIGVDEILAVDTSAEMLAHLDRKIARHGWTTISTSAHLPADAAAPFDRPTQTDDRPVSSTEQSTPGQPPPTSAQRRAAPFDLIVCSSVLGFVDDLDATVGQLTGLLAPGGAFVEWDWERVHDEDDHGLTRHEITSALERAELEDVAVRAAFELTVDDLTMSPLVASARRPRATSA